MFFQGVVEGPPDPVFGLGGAFQADVRPEKVSLFIGIYRDEELKAAPMGALTQAKSQIQKDDLLADYLPMDGYPPFLQAVGALAFGEELWKGAAERIYAAQGVGGTGALRVGAEVLAQEVSGDFSVSHLTWPNHRQIFERAGCRVGTHPYYDGQKGCLDFQAWVNALNKLPPKTIVVLHTCCHNPTGCDPTLQQWKEVSSLMLEKNLFPFFDFAYQGFGDGVEEDRLPIEIFLRAGHEMLVAYSCSKNFGLYSQRVGALFAVTANPTEKLRVGSQIKRIIRALYSNPPAHGARMVAHVLTHSALAQEWRSELDGMRERLCSMRETLAQKLPEEYQFLRNLKGMFGCLNFSVEQVRRLKEQFGIYLLENGRLSLVGLNHKNMDRVVHALLSVGQS